MPVDGDEAMGARLTKLLEHETALRVLTPASRPPALTIAAADKNVPSWHGSSHANLLSTPSSMVTWSVRPRTRVNGAGRPKNSGDYFST